MEELRLRYQEEEMQRCYPQAETPRGLRALVKEHREACLAETETRPGYPYPLKIKSI